MDVQTNHRQATATLTYFKRIKSHRMKMSRELKSLEYLCLKCDNSLFFNFHPPLCLHIGYFSVVLVKSCKVFTQLSVLLDRIFLPCKSLRL